MLGVTMIQISKARQEKYEENTVIRFQQLEKQMENLIVEKDKDSKFIQELTERVSKYDNAEVIKINTNKGQGFLKERKYDDSDNENEKNDDIDSIENLHINGELKENNLKSIDDLFNITAISTCCEEVLNSMISIIEYKEAMGDIKYIPSNLE